MITLNASETNISLPTDKLTLASSLVSAMGYGGMYYVGDRYNRITDEYTAYFGFTNEQEVWHSETECTKHKHYYIIEVCISSDCVKAYEYPKGKKGANPEPFFNRTLEKAKRYIKVSSRVYAKYLNS